jgi:hypothetical protein
MFCDLVGLGRDVGVARPQDMRGIIGAFVP